MSEYYRYQNIFRSRIATFDIFEAGLRRHHINAMLEFDVTESRAKLRELRKKGINISFNAWLIKVTGSVLNEHPDACEGYSGDYCSRIQKLPSVQWGMSLSRQLV